MSKLKLTPAMLRVLTCAARHRYGRLVSSALPASTVRKMADAGLIAQDGWNDGPLWCITAAGREVVATEKTRD